MSSPHRLGSGVAALAIVVMAAGCASGSGTAAKPAAPKPPTGPQLLSATVKSSQTLKSFSGTLNGTVTSQGTSITMSGTMEMQRKPLLMGADINMTIPGTGKMTLGMVMTPQEMYMKMPASLTQGQLKTPWMGFPLSQMKAGGTSLSTIFSSVSNDPASTTQQLAAAQQVRVVGTGIVDGVPVTEISGTESVPQAIASSKLPASAKTALSKMVEKEGLGKITFQVWMDAQHNVRKEIVNEVGSTFSEKLTMTMNNINQPVKVTPPPASQVTQIPASALSGSGL